jgi:hypothetical protein
MRNPFRERIRFVQRKVQLFRRTCASGVVFGDATARPPRDPHTTMTEQPHDDSFSEAHLDSPEYRERLMRKLNCLIAVLEVATAKVRKSLGGPDADVERLTRIRTNLQSTLDVCLRARAALERREALPADLPENLRQVVRETATQVKNDERAATFDKRITPSRLRMRKPPAESSSEREKRKFQLLRPIGKTELTAVDLDELSRRLQT